MLDGVASDMLDSMTVYKTLTPNLDADTIGGAIDLETISAFKHDGFHAKVKAETSWNELTGDSNNPKLAVVASNRFQLADGELGVALTLSDQSRRIVSETMKPVAGRMSPSTKTTKCGTTIWSASARV